MSTTTSILGLHARHIVDRLGFSPQESLVISAQPTPPAREGMIVRLDLADLHDAKGRTQLFEQLRSPLETSASSDVTIAYFTLEDLRDLRGIDLAVDAFLSDMGIMRVNTILADTVPHGPVRGDLGVIVPAAAEHRDAVALTLAAAPVGTVEEYLRLFWQVHAGAPLAIDLLAAVGHWLTTKAHRDAAIALIVGTGPQIASEVANGSGSAADAVMDGLFIPGRARRPGPETADHVEALTHLVAHLPSSHQVPPRTLLALIAWWQGSGALADRHLDHAVALDPSYRLARLLQHVLREGIAPGWAMPIS